jgi:hypothetical protein
LKSFAKLRARKSATCEWYCERSLSDMHNTVRMFLICAHATLRMTSNKAPLIAIWFGFATKKNRKKTMNPYTSASERLGDFKL